MDDRIRTRPLDHTENSLSRTLFGKRWPLALPRQTVTDQVGSGHWLPSPLDLGVSGSIVALRGNVGGLLCIRAHRVISGGEMKEVG